MAGDADTGMSEDERAFGEFVRQRYASARKPLNLSTLSHEILRSLPDAKSSDWFGKGSFRKALDSLMLPDVRFSMHQLWDGERHDPPAPAHAAPVLVDDTDSMSETAGRE